MQPLSGVRVLTMEQAAALPFMTRHLADLGAEVIRVQSHQRPLGNAQPLGLFRNKKLVGLDLASPGGPESFRELAAACDIVAHNYTTRVMDKFGLDFESIQQVQPRVIYCALTGFGSTGPWRSRPLFGPGAEAMSGQNAMIGEPKAMTPGRPGTITYADFVCGLYLLVAVLEALARRETLREAQFIDLSLYETGVSHLGTVLAERSLGAVAPSRIGNDNVSFGFHGVGPTQDGADVAISCLSDQLDRLLHLIGAESADQVWDAVRHWSVAELVPNLSGAGIACSKVQDMSDVVADARRWQRGCFTECNEQLHFAPVWSGGVGDTFAPSAVGADNESVYRDIVGLAPHRIQALMDSGTLGQQPIDFEIAPSVTAALDISRGLTARMEPEPYDWRHQAPRDRVDIVAVHGPVTSPLNKRVLELPASVGVAYTGKLLADLGWEVLRVERTDAPDEPILYRWGPGCGGAEIFLNQGKQSVIVEDESELAALAAEADVVLGGLEVWGLEATHVTACVTGFGRDWEQPWSDLTLQAASGLMSLTGEYDQAPQQLPPFAAQLTGALGVCSAILASVLEAQRDGLRRRLDLALVDVMSGFIQLQATRYAATGEVARREGRVKHALRMTPALDGFLYCAPGAVMNVDMRGVAELLNEPRLAEARFQTAEGRMQHWDEYVELMVTPFQAQPAAVWFEKAAALRLTFALVQTVDDLLTCPQLTARGLLHQVTLADGRCATMPGPPFRLSTIRGAA